jgi:hypothetical protein
LPAVLHAMRTQAGRKERKNQLGSS